MKLVSSYKDYYDKLQATDFERGRDDLWIRDKQEIVNNNISVHLPHAHIGSIHSLEVSEFWVCFCGKVYGGLKLDHTNSHTTPFLPKRYVSFAYTQKQFNNFIETHKLKINPKKQYAGKFWRRYNNKPDIDRQGNRIYGIREIDDWQQLCNKTDCTEINRKYKSPIVLIKVVFPGIKNEAPNIIVNPILRVWEFNKIVNSQTAWQEISMFNTGILGSAAPEMVKISDEDMKWKKGFDNWSFKKLPTKRKVTR